MATEKKIINKLCLHFNAFKIRKMKKKKNCKIVSRLFKEKKTVERKTTERKVERFLLLKTTFLKADITKTLILNINC